MRKKTLFTMAVAVVMVLAFATICVAAPVLTLNGKPFAVKPDAKGMVSAKAAFTALGCKVTVDKKNVMTITKGKVVIMVSPKAVTKNKKPVKVSVKAVKGDYLIPYTAINSLLGVKLALQQQAANQTTQQTQQQTQTTTQQQTQTTTQQQTKQQEVTAPGGLTGDKAVAYNLLTNSKYSGSVTTSLKSLLKNVIPIVALSGKVEMTINAKSSGTTTNIQTQGKPALVGGDAPITCKAVPFIEIASGDDDAIVAFLKSADSVSVSGNIITVKKATPPESLVNLFRALTDKITYKSSELNMNCTLKVTNGNLDAVTDIYLTGPAHGTNDMPTETTGSIQF